MTDQIEEIPEFIAKARAVKRAEDERNARLRPLALAVDEAAAALAAAVVAYRDQCIEERRAMSYGRDGICRDHVLANAAQHIRSAVASHVELARLIDIAPCNPSFALSSMHPAPKVSAEPAKPRDLSDFLLPARSS